MTQEQANALRIGDIIEHSTDICYWLGKITGRDKDGDWKVKNTGKYSFGCRILTQPNDFTLVGHSDIP